MKGYVRHSMDGVHHTLTQQQIIIFGVYYLETFIRTPYTQNWAKEKEREKEKGIVGTLHGQKGGLLQATHRPFRKTWKKIKKKDVSAESTNYPIER